METPQRIKEAAEKYAGLMRWINTSNEPDKKPFHKYISTTSYIAGATAENERAQGLVDALEFLKENGLCSETTEKIDKALAKWKGEGEQEEICGICKEKPTGKDITVCNDCYYNFDGDRRGFWKGDAYQ